MSTTFQATVVYIIQNNQAVRNGAVPQKAMVKRCEIQIGSQEIVMVGKWKKF